MDFDVTKTKINQKHKFFIKSDDFNNEIDSYKAFSSPSTIIKELIENSLDAFATEIKITITKKELNFIEVIDNGEGISPKNMDKLCQRFTTTKNANEEINFSNINTYGFKGEALAILSYLSNLTVISKVKMNKIEEKMNTFNVNQGCIKKQFKKGKEILHDDSKDYINYDHGTIILAERLYEGNDVLTKSLDPIKEIQKIEKIVEKYSIQFPLVSFYLLARESVYSSTTPKVLINTNNNIFKSLKNKVLNLRIQYLEEKNKNKEDDNHIDLIANNRNLSLVKDSNNTHLDLYSIKEQINQAVVELKLKILTSFLSSKVKSSICYYKKDNEILNISLEMFFSKPSFTEFPQSITTLFINNRLITKSSRISNCIDTIYRNNIINGGKFYYLVSLHCYNKEDIDFNQTTDKGKVLINKEDLVIKFIETIFKEKLTEENSSMNVFSGDYKGFSLKNNTRDSALNFNDNIVEVYPKDKVRVDPKTIKLDSFLTKSQLITSKDNIANKEFDIIDINIKRDIKEIETYNDDIILKEISDNYFEYSREDIGRILMNNFFIGIDKEFQSYIQYETSLFILNTSLFLEEFLLYCFLNNSNICVNTNNTLLKSCFRENLYLDSFNKDWSIQSIINFTENFFEIAKEDSIIAKINRLILNNCKSSNNDYTTNININSKAFLNEEEILKEIEQSLIFSKKLLEIIGIEISISSDNEDIDDINISENKCKVVIKSIKIISFKDFDFSKLYYPSLPNYLYSIYELCIKHYYSCQTNQNKNLNDKDEKTNYLYNINFILEMAKILSQFQVTSIFEFYNFSNKEKDIDEEVVNEFLEVNKQIKLFVESILMSVKETNFKIRNKIIESSLIEKLTDTDTLYTVFERC